MNDQDDQSAPNAGSWSRRAFLRTGTLAGAGGIAATALPWSLAFGQAPAIGRQRVQTPYGVRAGDVIDGRAMIWSRADRPARMRVEVATTPRFYNARRLRGPAALAASDYTAKLDVDRLPADQRLFYRVVFEDLANTRIKSEPIVGSFQSVPSQARPVRFVWSGDVAGQGFGINPDIGGMRIFEAMRRTEPDFFIHSGDSIYADDPIEAEQALPDGSVWKSLTTEGKSRVADTVEDFRANHAYNLLDDNFRRFNAVVPMIAQWDDHEVYNNWSPGEQLPADDPHSVKSADLLAARSMRAFAEYTPIRPVNGNPERIYKKFAYGPSLDVFRLDMRSYRGTNNQNMQTRQSAATAYLGNAQLQWLKTALQDSDATWKVIAADMPLGLVITDQTEPVTTFENSANGNGPARGRELEIAELLHFIKRQGVQNVVWLTADVHYTAAHYYDPNQAQFQDFAPFWEFVTGPLNSGTFGPNPLDNTFGPQVVFEKAPPEGQSNLAPSAGMQFFGQVDIDAQDQSMTVSLKDMAGSTLYRKVLQPGF